MYIMYKSIFKKLLVRQTKFVKDCNLYFAQVVVKTLLKTTDLTNKHKATYWNICINNLLSMNMLYLNYFIPNHINHTKQIKKYLKQD